MSENGGKPKRRPFPRLIPLLMLGSDGEVYACAPAHAVPKGVLQNKQTVIAVRLTHRERDIALDALQIGVVEASKTLTGIAGRKLDS